MCNTGDRIFITPGKYLHIWLSVAGHKLLEVNMKSSIHAVIVVSVLAAPVFAFAQQNSGPITREQVNNELAQLREAGYTGNASDTTYPAELQAALARVAEKNQAQAQMQTPQNSEYGTSSSGSSQAGSPQPAVDTQALYRGQ
jgi:hypothetical protein